MEKINCLECKNLKEWASSNYNNGDVFYAPHFTCELSKNHPTLVYPVIKGKRLSDAFNSIRDIKKVSDEKNQSCMDFIGK